MTRGPDGYIKLHLLDWAKLLTALYAPAAGFAGYLLYQNNQVVEHGVKIVALEKNVAVVSRASGEIMEKLGHIEAQMRRPVHRVDDIE